MKKIISLVLVLVTIVSMAGINAFATPTDTDRECMHLNEMKEKGYWANEGTPICDCETCEVILSDYNHIDKILDPKNTQFFFKDFVERLIKYLKFGNWQSGNYLLLSNNRKDGTSFVSFIKDKDLPETDTEKYKEKFEDFSAELNDILEGNETEKSKPILEALNKIKETCASAEHTTDTVRKLSLISCIAASVAAFSLGVWSMFKTPAPDSLKEPKTTKIKSSNPDSVKSSKPISSKFEECKYTLKLFLACGFAVLAPLFIMLFGAPALDDFLTAKIMNQNRCPYGYKNFL